jgi:hypothetical protein
VCGPSCVVRRAWVGGAGHRNGGVTGHWTFLTGRLPDRSRVRLFTRRAALTEPPFFAGALRLAASTGLEPYQPYWVEDGTRDGMRVQLRRPCEGALSHHHIPLLSLSPSRRRPQTLTAEPSPPPCWRFGCAPPSEVSGSRIRLALVLAPQTLNPESCGEPHSRLRRDNRSDSARVSITLSVGTPTMSLRYGLP